MAGEHQPVMTRSNAQVSLPTTDLAPALQHLMALCSRYVHVFGVLQNPVQFGLPEYCKGLDLIGYDRHTREAAKTTLSLVVTGRLDIEGFRTVAFDHVVTSERRFWRCHADPHISMVADAMRRAPSFIANSWPHRVIDLIEHATYAEGLCHFCNSRNHGKDIHLEWYGTQIREHQGPYVDLLIRTTDMDINTTKSEVRRRLSISPWVREDKLYELVSKIFPTSIIRREASPPWLGSSGLTFFCQSLG